MANKAIPSDFCERMTVREAFSFAQKKGFLRSLPWWKTMTSKKRIKAVRFAGRFWIHKDEVERVLREKPELHFSDLTKKARVA